MKIEQYISKREQWHQKIYWLSLVLIALTLPINRIATSIPILIMGLNWVIEGHYISKLKLAIKQPGFWLMIALYLVIPLGILNSTNKDDSFFDLQVKLSLWIFPLVVSSSPKLPIHKLRAIGNAFLLSCFFMVANAIFFAVLKFSETGDHTVFFYTKLVDFTSIHPSYLAMFLVMAIIIIVARFFNHWQVMAKWLKLIGVFGLLYFSTAVFLLSARMEIIALFIIANVIFLIWMYRIKKLGLGIGIFLLINVLAVGIISQLPTTQKRLVNTIRLRENKSGELELRHPDSRVFIWKATYEILKKNPILGVGNGDVKHELIKKFKEYGFEKGIEEHLNAHNQYLENWLGFGFLGFIILLLNLLIPFVRAVKRKQFVYYMFILLFGMCIVTESMLESQSGVVFFAFFNSLLFFVDDKPTFQQAA